MNTDFTPIELVGIASAEVGVPHNDGTPGSALYKVPIELSQSAPAEWASIFVEAWDNPSAFTSMHRRGICRVSGKRVILDGTTVEEIEKTHKATLKLALEVANRDYAADLARRARATQQQEQDEAAARVEIQRKAKDVKF